MPHPDTNALVERIFKDDRARKALYSHAARFFGRSVNQQRAGLDAHHLVGAVVEKVLENGNLHEQPNPTAYLMKAITNAGIDAKKRYDNYQQKLPQMLEPNEIAPLNHETTTINDLAAAEVLQDTISSMPERAQRVARAILDDPDKNINELAAHLDVSRDTVRRAKQDIRRNASLRGYVQSEAESPPTPHAPHP